MDRNATAIELTSNGVILAVTDPNPNHASKNSKLTNKQKQKTPKVQRSIEGYIQRSPSLKELPEDEAA